MLIGIDGIARVWGGLVLGMLIFGIVRGRVRLYRCIVYPTGCIEDIITIYVCIPRNEYI